MNIEASYYAVSRDYHEPTLTDKGNRYDEYRMAARLIENVYHVTEYAAVEMDIVDGKEVGAWVTVEVHPRQAFWRRLVIRMITVGDWKVYVLAKEATSGDVT